MIGDAEDYLPEEEDMLTDEYDPSTNEGTQL